MDTPPFLSDLLQRRSEYLRFLARRVGNAATAEDILQDALSRTVERAGNVPEGEAAIGWFYRVLENAVVDHYRRTSTTSRALDQVERESGDLAVVPDDAPSRTCKCVGKLKATLKVEYAQALDRIEVEGVAVKDFAEEAGITRSNAAVRVFRAREALREKVKQTCGYCAAAGCTDCSCSH
jgi:RNA polymerase sigma factor (sigma-70 family)